MNPPDNGVQIQIGQHHNSIPRAELPSLSFGSVDVSDGDVSIGDVSIGDCDVGHSNVGHQKSILLQDQSKIFEQN